MGAITPGAPVLKSPLVACLWITERCNLQCSYCYAYPARFVDMPSDRMLKLAEELIDMEVFDVTVAGGEPFLHPGVFSLIDRLLTGGINLGVLSNGTLLTAAKIHELTDTVAGREHFLLQVSLDDLDPSRNDLTRGHGRQVRENLDRLCSETELRLQIATVITVHNIDHIVDIIRAYYPRVKRYHIMNLQRTAASLRYPELFPAPERNEMFWESLEETMKSMPSDILVTGLNLMRLMSRMARDPDGNRPGSSFRCPSCTAGHTHVEITAALDVIGCDIAKDFSIMGNLEHATFSEIWNSERANMVRSYPFPPCYYVTDTGGNCLAAGLSPDMRLLGDSIREKCRY